MLDKTETSDKYQTKAKPSQQSTLTSGNDSVQIPSISLPKGGGAIRSIDEKLTVNPVTGTGSLSIPLPLSPGRGNFTPQLALSYDSGAGNSPFGLGWNLSLPAITRKTDKGLPCYHDDEASDTFVLSGVEDLVPELVYKDDRWQCVVTESADGNYLIQRYRPRIEGSFARIERWQHKHNQIVYWSSISKDNITTIYGKNELCRIADPGNRLQRIFSWLIEASYDDKGNLIVYEYKEEQGENIDELPIC